METNDINVYKAALKKAAEKINELDEKLKHSTEKQDIAVIGYHCRFPGGANNPSLFWERLAEGYDAVTEISEERFSKDSYFSTDSQEKGKMFTKYGCFIDKDIKKFDNVHFEISPVEASSIDPQQRLLLEVSWEAFENAGININEIMGSNTGVFIGIDAIDYVSREMVSGKTEDITPYTLVGVSSHAAAGRVSYFYDFKGPAACVSTACSSSLTALNMAVDSLRNGQCDMALVGGVNLIMNPEPYIGLSQFHALSPDGRCKTFDAAADGFGRGEGCGMVILKRMNDAKKDKNTVEAVIKEVYMGHDGKSNGFFAPNGLAEQRVITGALKQGGFTVNDIDYIEAHGTGTTLGDFIEAQAVCDAFRNRTEPIKIGSVKSNIGHLEACAGMASLIKVLLSLKHKQIPASIHFKNPNPNIDWEKIQVVDHLTEWKTDGRKRRAGINGFGISGTLAHVIVEEAEEVVDENPELPMNMITISTKNRSALLQGITQMRDFLEQTKESVGSIAYTTNVTREKNEYRFAAVGEDKEQLIKEMNHALEDEEARKFYTGRTDGKKKKTAFLFTGQGSIYQEVAKQFYETSKEYREAFDRCEARFQELLNISIQHAVFEGSEEEDLTCAYYSQPVIFSLEYSLTKIWDTLGIKPDYVIGHSVGEYAALCYSGMLSFEEASRMIALRSKMMMTVQPNGKMVGVLATREALEQAIVESGCQHVSIGAENAAKNVTLSGLKEEVDQVIDTLQKGNRVFINDLGILYPYHSVAMKEYSKVYEDSLDNLVCKKGKVKVISTVTGKLETEETFGKKEYWIQHLEKTVFFMKAMQEAERLGVTTFIEIGGNATLCGLAGQCIQNSEAVFVPTMRNTIDDYRQLMESLKQLYVKGINIDFAGFYENYKKSKVALPSYPFDEKEFWIERTEPVLNKGPEPMRGQKSKNSQTSGKQKSVTKKTSEPISSDSLQQLLKKQNQQMLMQKKILEQYRKKQ